MRRIQAQDDGAGTPAAPLLHCHVCGLSLRAQPELLVIEHCPRCLARLQIRVKLSARMLPARQGEIRDPGVEPSAAIGRDRPGLGLQVPRLGDMY